MARLDEIRGKHRRAMEGMAFVNECLPSGGQHHRALTRAITHAHAAFTELLQYHKTFQTAAGTAAEIERKT